MILQFDVTNVDSHERCRNQGGHDLTSCSVSFLPPTEWDGICFDKKPIIKFCHIPGLNGDSNDPHFTFSPYSFFTADTAHKTCEKIGGKVPDLTKEYDALLLAKAIEYLSSFVRFGRPYSLRWTCWPVSSLLMSLH